MDYFDLLNQFYDLKKKIDINNKTTDIIHQQVSDLDEKQQVKIKFTDDMLESNWKLFVDDLFFHRFDKAIHAALWYNSMAIELLDLSQSINAESKAMIDKMTEVVEQMKQIK